MSTLEDVMYLYERNSRIYHDCKLKKCLESCESAWNEECYCCYKQTVFPYTIGDQTLPCSMKVRCYIRPGDECPVCLEKIYTQKTAYITGCGHAFHKSCLFNIMKTKWMSTSYAKTVRCPMCRKSLGRPDMAQRYCSNYLSSNNHRDSNGLDKLEDYWLSNDLQMPYFCSDGYDHFLGLGKNCYICDEYREKGDLLFEIA